MRNKILIYRVTKALNKNQYIRAGRLMGITTDQMLNMTTMGYINHVLETYMNLISKRSNA